MQVKKYDNSCQREWEKIKTTKQCTIKGMSLLFFHLSLTHIDIHNIIILPE